MSSAIGILVPIIQQLTLRVDVTTPAQLESVMGDPGWQGILWAKTANTSVTTAKSERARANAAWRLLSDYVKRYLVEYVLNTPGADPPRGEPPKVTTLVTLVFGMALREREWPLVDVLLKRFAFEEEAGIKPVSAMSSLPCVHRSIQLYAYMCTTNLLVSLVC